MSGPGRRGPWAGTLAAGAAGTCPHASVSRSARITGRSRLRCAVRPARQLLRHRHEPHDRPRRIRRSSGCTWRSKLSRLMPRAAAASSRVSATRGIGSVGGRSTAPAPSACLARTSRSARPSATSGRSGTGSRAERDRPGDRLRRARGLRRRRVRSGADRRGASRAGWRVGRVLRSSLPPVLALGLGLAAGVAGLDGWRSPAACARVGARFRVSQRRSRRIGLGHPDLAPGRGLRCPVPPSRP